MLRETNENLDALIREEKHRVAVEFMQEAWNSAMQEGIDTFIEFGGGLGKGETPAEKRPNLESIIKKTMKSSGYEAGYRAAINVETVRDSAA